jgi:AraC-like DNA-binding protein
MARVIHRTFNAPRDYQRAVRMAKLCDFVISEPGVFEASLTIMRIGVVWLQSGSENLSRTQHIAIGELPRSIIFLADENARPVVQSGEQFGAGDVASFGRNTSHFQRTFGPIRWAAMALVPDNLEAAFQAMTGREFADPSASLCVKPPPARLARLRQLFQQVNRMGISGEAILDHPEVRQSLEQALIVAMVGCLSTAAEKVHSAGWHRHQQIMRRFKEWLDANNNRAAYLQEVCAALEVSAPTLRRCCEEHLGMSPMQYLGLRRLNLARQELQRKNAQTSVTATAMNYGFWHLGRFADEYRSLFGESPSATLARHSAR